MDVRAGRRFTRRDADKGKGGLYLAQFMERSTARFQSV